MKEFSSYSSPDARDFSYATSDLSEIQRTLVALVEKMTGQSRLINRYQDFLMNNQGADQFWQDVIDALELNVCVQNTGATTIPESGPLLVVANHPFGLVDGAAIAHLIDTVRRDFKIVCWDIFDHPPHISDYLLPMDLSEGTSARKQNIKVRRRAIDELNAGGAIIVFPAGSAEMSHSLFGPPTEMPWGRFTARLALATDASVLPIFVRGHNSRLFHIASRLSYSLRLGLFSQEIGKKIGENIDLVLGKIIPSPVCHSFQNEQILMDFLFLKTMQLASLAKTESVSSGLPENKNLVVLHTSAS